MAEIVENENIGELEAVENLQQETSEPKVQELPEKYRGKATEDLVKMHQEAEKLISRQAQEVGEVRRLADELLKSQFSNTPEKQKPKEVDFFEDPKEAIRYAIENNPHVIEAGKNALKSNQLMAKQSFEKSHPDAMELVNDSEFINYVKSSPVRMELFKRADNYDVDSANELFGNYKLTKATKQAQGKEIEHAERDKAIKSVSVDTGGSGDTGKKVYSSSALRLLQIRDRAKYDSMQDEILAAYREDRVR